MSRVECCPYCRCLDIRPITPLGIDLAGFQCHDCTKVFYVAAVQMPPQETSRPTAPEPKRRDH